MRGQGNKMPSQIPNSCNIDPLDIVEEERKSYTAKTFQWKTQDIKKTGQ